MIYFCFVELVLELVKSSGSVLESENAEACISFSTAFAMDFSINVGNIFSSNVTVDGIGKFSFLNIQLHREITGSAHGHMLHLNSFPSVAIATPGTDFMSPSSVLAEANVHGPSTDLCFNLAIEDDNAVEVEECFSVSISLPSPESDNLLLTIDDDSDTSLCCITDNDSKIIGCTIELYLHLKNHITNLSLISLQLLSLDFNLIPTPLGRLMAQHHSP